MSKALILVVDDDHLNRELMEDVLGAYGYQALLVNNGLSALEIARDRQPNLILMDVRMPTIDGFETCRRLKESETTRHIPVVLITGMEDSRDQLRKADEAGAQVLLERTGDITHLIRVIGSLVNKQNT